MADPLVNVVAPGGELVAVQPSQLNQAKDSGYRIASPEEVQQHFRQEQFSTAPQQALTALEGAGEGVAGPLFTAAERASGLTTPENMLARRETNPGIHALGQGAGVVGSALTGVGDAPILESLGKGAAEMAGLGAPTGALGRISAAGVNSAAQMAALQSGDEISRMLMNDPSQSMQTAIVNVGLSALLGGAAGSALGAVNPLWEASGGAKLSQFLEDFKDRMQFHMTGAPEQVSEASQPITKQVFDPFTKKTIEKIVALPPEASGAPAEEVELTPGQKAADYFVKKGLEKFAGSSIGGALGGAAGSVVGHPWLGAAIGERALGPFFDSVLPAIIKPVMQNLGDGGALKSAIDYGMAVIQGDKLMSLAAKNVFKPGAEILANSALPKMKDREKLMNRLENIEQDPGQFMNQTDKYTQYLPEHAGAKGATIGAAYEFLKQAQPKPAKTLILDQEKEPSPHQKAEFDKALDLAQQPALAFQKIKNGTITTRDMALIQQVYPAFYKSAVAKLHDELVNHLAKEGSIPYHTRLGLAKFFGEPLDSTMLPGSLMSIQQSMQTVKMPPQPQMPKRGRAGSNGKVSALEKQSELMESPQQASEQRHRAQF